MQITIRPCRPADWPRLQQIHDPARRNELALAGMPDAFRPLAEVAEEEGLFDYPHLDVAEVDGTAAGFAAYTNEELGWVYVDPAFSRKGIGRALLRRPNRTSTISKCWRGMSRPGRSTNRKGLSSGRPSTGRCRGTNPLK